MNIRLVDFMDPDVVKSSGTTCAETLEMQRLCFDWLLACLNWLPSLAQLLELAATCRNWLPSLAQLR